MDYKKLDRANELEKEIRHLKSFIERAESVRGSSLTFTKKVAYMISGIYGVHNQRVLELNKELELRIILTLDKYLMELEKEWEEL